MPLWAPYAVTWLVSTLLGGAAAWAALRSSVSRLDVRISRIESEIGTHETGLRGSAHAQASHTSILYGKIGILDHRVEALERRGH